MPSITTLPFDSSIISLSIERDLKRSKGLHLSTIIRDLLLTLGVRRAASTKGWTEEDSHLNFQKGFLWEQMVQAYIETPEWQAKEWDFFASKHMQQVVDDSILQSKGHIIRPGEVEMDGIFMTPDALNVRLHHLEEWKATAIRAKNFNIETRKPEWIWQGAAYCRRFNMTRTIYRVWHLADLPSVCNQIVVDWTGEEIERNWSQVLDHRKLMLSRTS